MSCSKLSILCEFRKGLHHRIISIIGNLNYYEYALKFLMFFCARGTLALRVAIGLLPSKLPFDTIILQQGTNYDLEQHLLRI